MNMKISLLSLLFFSICTTTLAQNKAEKKRGMLSYSINFSDYNFIRLAQDSSISAAFNQKGIFKSGNSSFGLGVSYWKGLTGHIDFSANLSGTFSNFPAKFIKGDSIGQASFTPQLDGLLHFRMFKDDKTFNPFLTGGIGAGYFGDQLAVYAPVGAGFQFHFNTGAYIFIQAQWRMALTDAISNDYTFYSIGFAHQAKKKSTKKKPEAKVELPAVDSAKEVQPKDTLVVQKSEVEKAKVKEKERQKEIEKEIERVKAKDNDGDGFPNEKDECPQIKGSVKGCPDSDGDGIADKDDNCKDVKGVARYKGCPVPDTDGDGVNDDEDQCKLVRGTKENHGCPADKDGDGVADNLDKCPDVAGSEENNGCPMKVVEGAKILKSTKDSITYYLRFDFDRANISNEAFGILNQVIQILKTDKTLQVTLAGHADNFGDEKYNLRISEERANIARDYLISYGIARNRIKTSFHGSSMPFDIHQQWLDRRVEISIIKK